MELRNEFSVGLAIDKAWALLTDLEQIAPCMPGAKLEAVEGDDYLGLVKVKVGPITMSFRGTATFVEQDEGNHRAVLRAEGRDTRGQGNAHATITAQLEPEGDGTRVAVVTDLAITGKIAQFGRGALSDVSTKLLGQFVESLEVSLLGEHPAPDQTSVLTPGATTRTADPEPVDPEPVDLLGAVGVPRAVRWLVPAVAVVLVLLWLRRHKRTPGPRL